MVSDTRGTLERSRTWVAAVALAAVATFGAATEAQGPRQALPSLVPESLVGSVSFDLYCASCHGRLGKGDGPTASSLRTPPADLTAFSQRSGGTFSRERFFAFVEGSSRAAAHGGSEMPVWGPTLRALDASDARVTVRLRNLAAFVESIQESPRATPGTPRALDGASLFATSCSACHGASGRGDGVMAGQMRRSPSNLTTFATRNGGVFPSERLRGIVDGTGVAAHGDRDMPVWGAVFKRTGNSRDDAAARIDAIVKFLETLQERRAE